VPQAENWLTGRRWEDEVHLPPTPEEMAARTKRNLELLEQEEKERKAKSVTIAEYLQTSGNSTIVTS
jgi:hypothetical protein